MIETLATVFHSLGGHVLGVLPSAVALGVGFTALSWAFTPCNPGMPWWRKPDLLTDVLWFFITPFFARVAVLAVLVATLTILPGIAEDSPAGLIGPGRGPLAGLSFWSQLVVYLVGLDAMLYVSHRAFHTASLWRYHAVHHSPEHLDWTSARRFHPVETALHFALPDCILLALGIAPEIFLIVAPYNVAHSALVHANLDWSFGPFKYVLAGPVFHRWHHTDVERGGSKNFAPTFPVIDLLFGTFYMPAGVLPDEYGVDDKAFPDDFSGQLVYPFQGRDAGRAAPETPANPGTVEPSLTA
jgi:sterol desaturase/sphingolipid hydroxylase (fatty acid hydroxylase superfamily)